MKELIRIFQYKLIWLNILICLFLLIASFYYSQIAAFLFIFLSNLFDILGYHFVLIRRSIQIPEKIIVRSYRINQFLFDLLLLLLIGLQFNWLASLNGWIMKLFGVQDILYYLILNLPLPEKWTWMKWTPLSFVKGNLLKTEIVLQAITGVLLSIIILLFIQL